MLNLIGAGLSSIDAWSWYLTLNPQDKVLFLIIHVYVVFFAIFGAITSVIGIIKTALIYFSIFAIVMGYCFKTAQTIEEE